MTEKLYYADSHLFGFDARVEEIITDNGRKAVVLDRTAFFPEGGGQPADRGNIESVSICDVQEKDGKILHYTESDVPFAVGDTVSCRLDEETRFARMQAHSGEHIVSGVAHDLFGAENVGFHMIDLIMTVDLDKPLTKEEIVRIEKEANKAVYRNVAIHAEIIEPEQLKTLQYRSKLDLKENVRIVTIEGIDKCACCAPHVSRTGEIGLIKILSAVSHRGGVRLTLVCGMKAYEDYRTKHDDIMRISDTLKAPNNETPAAVGELLDRIAEGKHKADALRQKMYDFICGSINCSPNNIVVFIPGLVPDELRELADLCKQKTSKIFAVFSGNDADGYAFAVSSDTVKLKSLSRDINMRLAARGGGRDEMLQGRASASEREIRKFFEEIEGEEL